MTRKEIKGLLNEAEKRFASEAKLILLKSGKVIFVGDTHGDLEATEKIIHRYLKSKNKLVFLGDYVDRGPASLQNINFLLQQKIEHPDSLYLLMGNHECYAMGSFHPADFWEGLDAELRQRYSEALSRLPLAVSMPNGIIALHGALPNVSRLEDINKIEPGSAEWHQITWGDWQESAGKFLGMDPYSGRPQFGRGWFKEIMSRLGKNVLIRSHQPDAPPTMYGKRCLTIFTSSAYKHYVPERTIAVVDLKKPVNGADDIEIETI
ncbi:MAG: serine/threonine protein phosphatase [Dehalococcoidia bacterium]|nr:serine/threonine protein phosphatase [Dehalococcoidia bacterium]MDH4299111.1 serine/threonine protein phosphatase [Dehalococcoidia bacterium]MDH4367869.1 serine/threonine protein phosphatase [Dehalococcoidia bacterium]